MDIEENTIGHQTREPRDGEMDPHPSPVMIYSLCLDAEELLTVYAGLRTYLKTLAGRENETENLGQIQRVAKLLIEINPRAVEASKEISLKAVGMEAKHDGTE